MTVENAESRGEPRQSPQTDAGDAIPETTPAAAAAHHAVSPSKAAPKGVAAAAIFKGVANVVFMALVIYLTYIFTMFISTRPLEPSPVPESMREAAKKIEELRAEERKLLTTYGPVNPATKAVRIPIDRAMELVIAEGSQPAPAAGASSIPAPAPQTPKAGTAGDAAPKADSAAGAPRSVAVALLPRPTMATPAPVAPPARAGMAPEQMYRAVCIACHDVDGRGALVRKAMPTIPDFTDPRWQATRTDADLQRSITEGKGQLMLAMKDKLSLAHTDVKDMVAFVRSYQPGRSATTAGSTSPALPAMSATPTLAASGPAATIVSPAPVLTPALTSSAPVAIPSAIAPLPTTPAAATPQPSALPLASRPLTSPIPGTVATAASSARAAKLRVAGEFYNINCVACHGPDGRGSTIRVAMPVIPDFTSREWNTSHENPQLAVSILEGKNTLMPPWRGRVDPALAQDLVAFIRGFGPPGLIVTNTPTSEFGTRMRGLRQQWQELDQQVRSLSGP